jgi:hypothetical protein
MKSKVSLLLVGFTDKLYISVEADISQITQPFIAGTSPSPRKDARVTSYGNLLIVFGGTGIDGFVHNDLFILNIGGFFF